MGKKDYPCLKFEIDEENNLVSKYAITLGGQGQKIAPGLMSQMNFKP